MLSLKQSRVRKRLAEARQMVQRGMSRREVIRALQEIGQGCSRATACRTLELVDAEHARSINKSRGAILARQNAKLNHAQRLALAKDDLGNFIRAIREQDEILGLKGGVQVRERLAYILGLMKATIEQFFADDPERGQQFVSALTERIIQGSKTPKGIVEGEAISREVTVVEVQSEADSTDPGGRNP